MKRPGDWSALGYGEDPIDGDEAALVDRIAYYKKVAQAITDEAAVLHRIAGGTDLVGKYADKIRDGAGEVADDLDKVTGRYEAVTQALVGYEPALPVALSQSASCLQDATEAQQRLTAAQGQPATPATGQTQAEADLDPGNPRNVAVQQAQSDLAAAQSRMRGVMAALDDAGRAAARTIRAALDDGLRDSLGDKIAYFFLKLIAILVKILTYIAMALAAIALIIPGLGELIFAVGVAAFVGQAILTATGNGSGLDLIMAGLGVLSFGVGKAIEAGIEKGIGAAVKGSIGTAVDNSADNADILAKVGKAQDQWDALQAKAGSGEQLSASDEAFLNAGRPVLPQPSVGMSDLAKATDIAEEVRPTTIDGVLTAFKDASWSSVLKDGLLGQGNAARFPDLDELNATLAKLGGGKVTTSLWPLQVHGAVDSGITWVGGSFGAAIDAGNKPVDWDQVQASLTSQGNPGEQTGLDTLPGIFSPFEWPT